MQVDSLPTGLSEAIASGKLLYDTGSPARHSVVIKRGGREKGERFTREEICIELWLVHIVLQQEPTQHCKVITLQLKNKLKEE